MWSNVKTGLDPAATKAQLVRAMEGHILAEGQLMEKHPELITGENSAEKLLERVKAEKVRLAGNGKKQRLRKTNKK